MRSFLLSLLLSVTAFAAELPKEQRIVFLGDSITQGGGYIEFIEAALIAQHPEVTKEIIPLGLSSETVSGLSEDGHAGGKFPRPDLHERLDRALEKTKPELVFACYGMNDGIYYPLGAVRTKAFQDGMKKLHEKVTASGARIVHLTPPVFDPLPIKARLLPAGLDKYENPYQGYNEVLDFYSDWLVDMRKKGWEVMDIHGPMNAAIAEKRKTDPEFTFSKDGVHPGAEGHLLMAHAVLDAWGLKVKPDGTPDHPNGAAILALVKKKHAILRPAWLSYVGHKRPGNAPGLPIEEAKAKVAELDAEARKLASAKGIVIPNQAGEWNGYAKHELTIAGKSVTVVAPKTAASGRPWVWHGEFFGHKPAPDIALLGKGFHIVYMKINDMLGSPGAVKLWDACYAELTTKYGLSTKPSLVGLSRGGLYCYNWAIANPDKVSCIYADAPVCDFKSWPGGKGKGKGDAKNWALVPKLWGFKDEAEALAYKGNPVDSLAPLAKNHVPLLHVYGDADDVVPWDENTSLIESRYKALGGSITLIRKPGVGHHPHGLDDSTPIIEFIAKNAK
ncbi:GDSL-type esterase/lipase family protein [Prosthecobacter sp.]|uniref:SGNH/GDSL hydrolase family protein n=1 Tax=Prosthecobacter sp. TaxID=1965333 RepID=UPI0024897DAB|nr:GDSL-type esterase/lipase family protein [Prosthecobacter sp.]MDI1313024.1 GDSL-type esterase/lipase family protein [Prosthecobacter sp.]